jgi:hypothetical protein
MISSPRTAPHQFYKDKNQNDLTILVNGLTDSTNRSSHFSKWLDRFCYFLPKKLFFFYLLNTYFPNLLFSFFFSYHYTMIPMILLFIYLSLLFLFYLSWGLHPWSRNPHANDTTPRKPRNQVWKCDIRITLNLNTNTIGI